MSNVYSSPGDPLFWLHHGGLDMMWNEWQRKGTKSLNLYELVELINAADWNTRKSDIGGPDTQWAYPFNFFGDIPYRNVTLDFVMNFGEFGNTKIGDDMDIQQQLCYRYKKEYF